MGVFTLKNWTLKAKILKKSKWIGLFITQCEKESIGHVGDNPLFISSIVLWGVLLFRKFSFIVTQVRCRCVCFSAGQFDVCGIVRFFYLTLLCHPRYNFGGFYHPHSVTRLFYLFQLFPWDDITEQVEVWLHLKYTCVLWSPMDTCGYSSAGHNSQVNGDFYSSQLKCGNDKF